MAFKRFLAGMGVGGATVETELAQSQVRPGDTISGTVAVIGGGVDQVVEAVNVSLAARVEVESGDHEYATTVEFAKQRVWGGFPLAAGARYGVKFELAVPWEAPITVLDGASLRGMFVGLSTEVEIARAVDKGDLDPVHIHPLPAQQQVLAALSRLGFRIKGADLERGHIRGSQMPFYQEIEYLPSRDFARHMSELELTFLAAPTHMDVVLEADNRGGLFSEGRDTYARFRIDYARAASVNWDAELHGQLRQLASRRGWF